MNRIALGTLIAVALFLGPLFIYGVVQDYAAAARDEINRTKPPAVKISQARRQIEDGNQALGRAKAQIIRIQREQTRLQDLLEGAPMPVAQMHRRHEELKSMVAKASRSGELIRYAGRNATPQEMRLVLIRQRTHLESMTQYKQALSKLVALENRLESTVLQARHERALATANLEYARTLTKIASAIAGPTDSGSLWEGAQPYGGANETLAEVIAQQETTLALDGDPIGDEGELFKRGTIDQP